MAMTDGSKYKKRMNVTISDEVCCIEIAYNMPTAGTLIRYALTEVEIEFWSDLGNWFAKMRRPGLLAHYALNG